jgi:hypothetical protein
MDSGLEVFEFVVKGIDLFIDFFHSSILFHVLLLGSLGGLGSFFENVLFLDAIQSDYHLFFALFLTNHSFMLQHLF